MNMSELESKYIELLLCRCINFDKSKSLLVSYAKEHEDFIQKLVEKAKQMGVNDIYLESNDEKLKHDILKNNSAAVIKSHDYFNKSIWDEYAKKNASFLMLETVYPGIFDDIEPEKFSAMRYNERTTKPIYKEKQLKGEIPWCIACLPSREWAIKVLGESDNPKEDLFRLICKMCMVDTDNPIESWNDFLIQSNKKAKKLNELGIKKLYYKNSLGTDLTITLNDKAVWCNAGDDNGGIVNMPSYEIFTTPDFRETEGIVYSSKPLIYCGAVIDEFYLKFENGKVVDFGAKKGYEVLKGIIEMDEYSLCLGEAALVNNDSLISNTNVVFETTLFDENASCHFALGSGFNECIKDGNNLSKDELFNLGVNPSLNHVDFMIGTSDLSIIATTDNGDVSIFENGNFVI